MQSKKTPKIKIDKERCKSCGFCVMYCPKGLIQLSKDLNKKGLHYAEFKKIKGIDCVGCTFCAVICPDVCIEVYK